MYNPTKVPRELSKSDEKEMNNELEKIRQKFETTLEEDEEAHDNKKELAKKLTKEENEITKKYQKKAQDQYNERFMDLQSRIRESLAKKIAMYRDSTFLSNYHHTHKFVKIAEWGGGDDTQSTNQQIKEVIENIECVLKYLPMLIPNGGLDNILRISLHIGNTTLQLPFYHNIMPHPLFTISELSKNEGPDTNGAQIDYSCKRDESALPSDSKDMLIKTLSHCRNLVDLHKKANISQCSNPVLNGNKNLNKFLKIFEKKNKDRNALAFDFKCEMKGHTHIIEKKTSCFLIFT
ncbi:hypothetical protein RFI_14653 [Reticulomyxa filosa]|uniref:Uncharacterized protein n=1 Tax=Reticulomyxa filosa TaxID=46433 RepID=X6N8E3_RETFI|nr:hypothetical protein RFI_14653 [Reticulomyxa filosa]|eukprot:ETO22550.1 hypothetical protein RFI_14653 [Reticulomyxa filosa]